ncbi:uncharacterized protein IL334_001624 [Kwoniella shivajii]|uniref:Mediator of RNA polymerase II transcription subunit 12 n=1 Tax=Kwoniella shivajii TaxID=564305 RepID=A0ABZ1CSF7_9TREE|nr:hypothetical protein IL334_001624 [Kwoniella shivajii]
MPTSNRYPPGINPYASTSSKTTSNQKAQRPSLTSRPHVQASKALLDDVEIEEFHPPEWRTVLSSRVDLGYPDFYPSRPGFDQPEDVLTEENVKNGFTGKNFIAVGAEVFSMHGPIHNHLTSGGLNLLQQLGKDLIQKRQDMMPKVGERAFRIPVRVTYNDTKRIQFLTDLANPNVPLHKLMRTPVPHGFKGLELLDSMFSPSIVPSSGHNRTPSGSAKVSSDPIPIDRALWFIRVLGSNEISAHRGRTQPQSSSISTPVPVQAPSPAQAATPSSTTTIVANPTLPVSSNDWYTQEFTNTFISWIRIQLSQLTLPNSSKTNVKPGVPSLKAPTGVLSDEKMRVRWLAKWDYSTRLMRELHQRQLLSTRSLSGWMADFLGHANLAQLGFVSQLIGEYLGDMLKHICNARHCIKAACDKVNEIRISPAAPSLSKVEAMLVSIIQSLSKANPEVLFSPITWKLHSSLLLTILPSTSKGLTGITDRNEAMWFKMTVDERSSSPRRQQMADIQKLDSICEDTNMLELTRSFFDGNSSATSASPDMTRLEDKIFILLNWAMGLFQLGSHRPYAVYTILKHWHEQQEERQAKQSNPNVVDLFPLLYKWLDTSAAARKEENVQAIGITIGEITRQGMFSYGRYLETLIAKGQTARGCAHGQSSSHHLPLLRAMPIFVVAKDLVHQRRIALCGDDTELKMRDEAEETMLMDQFREEVIEYIPELFGYTRFWLAPGAGAFLTGDNERSAMNASTFSRVLQVFRTCRGYATIADFIIRALHDSDDQEILDVIIDTVRRDADVWTAMDGWSRLGDKLLDRYHALQTRGREHPRTLELLDYLVMKGRLNEDEVDEVTHIHSEMFRPPLANIPGKLDFHESLPSFQQVLSGAKEEAAINLASKLFVRHGTLVNWSSAWWTSIIGVLQHPSAHVSHESIVRTINSHIIAVKRESKDSLEPVIISWLESSSPAALIETFGKRSGVIIIHFLLGLIVNRCLSTLTVLERLVYPIWKHVSGSALAHRKRLSSKQTQAVTNIINISSQLLVSPPLVDSLPPTNSIDSLVVLAYRQAVFCGTSVQNFIRHLPLLVVLGKSNLLPDSTTSTISSMLRCLAMTAEFKTAAFRNLNVLKDAFLSTEWSKPSSAYGLEAGMEDTLKLIMSEKPPNASTPASKSRLSTFDNTARLSAWKWTRIVLEMRSDFKGLALRIANGEDIADARYILNRQVHATLDRAATADDTDLLCEAFRGMDSVVTQEVLRILDSTYNHSTQSQSDNSVLASRHKLLDLLAVALQSIDRQMSDSDLVLHQDLSPPRPGILMQVVTILLKFTLGIMTTESTSPTMPKPNFPNLAVSYFKVMLSCHNALSPELAQAMSDMLAYIIDSCQTALLGEITSTSVQAIVTSSSHLARALPHLSPVRRNIGLLGPDVTEESLDSALPLDDRKWELFEQMNPPPRPPQHQDLYLTSTPIKDTSSISMSLFNPKITRDVIPGIADSWTEQIEEEPSLPWEDYASERDLGDGFKEPNYVKQISTQLYNGTDEHDLNEHETGNVDENEDSSDDESGIPLSKNQSRRMSTRSQKSISMGNGISFGSNNNPISIDEDSDDNPEPVDNPPPASKRPRTASKSTASASASVSASVSGKQSTTAGKAPARKTTGGKGISRKATAGKSVRGTAGKAPRGRRKSQAE